jgi:hypothetical protein
MMDFQEYKDQSITVRGKMITVATAIGRIAGELNEPDGKNQEKAWEEAVKRAEELGKTVLEGVAHLYESVCYFCRLNKDVEEE